MQFLFLKVAEELSAAFSETNYLKYINLLGGKFNMPLARVLIENFKSIKHCNITTNELTILIGENGAGKTNILEAIQYL